MNDSNLRLGRGRYYGMTLATATAGEITLAEGRYAGHTRIPAHAHSGPYLCLVLEGSFEESWGSRTETCDAGTLVFHHAHEVHADRFGGAGARCFNLEPSPRLVDRLKDERALPRSRLTLAPGRASAMAAALRGAPSGLDVEDAVLGLLAELEPPKPAAKWRGRRPPWLDSSIERLRMPSPPSIASLADEAGVHPVYFARVFRTALHATPGAVARRARLERAAGRLLGDGNNVAAVAHEAGFADHSHFCRQFRREFGVTPSGYRQLFR